MKIQEICKIVNGSTPSTSNESFWDGDIPWITPKDMSFLQGRYIGKGSRNITKAGYDSCSTTMLPTNAVLLTSRAPIGYVAIASNPVCTNQGFKSLLCNPKFVLAEYMYYWLSSKTAYLQSIAGGSTFKELSKDQLGSAEIDLPSIETQRHIVDAIGSIDNLIEKYQKIYSKCLAFIENSFCLFESPNEKKDDFGSICQFLNGYVFKSKEYYVNGEMKVITIKNIGSKGFDSTDCDKINMRSEFVPYLLSIGDLVLTMTGNIGRFGIVDEADCLLNQRVLKIWAPSMSYIVGYLSRHKEEIMQLGKGTAQKNLSFNELKGMPVFNSKHEIINFAKNDWAYELMVQAKTKINAAKAVKTHLLNRYFGTE